MQVHIPSAKEKSTVPYLFGGRRTVTALSRALVAGVAVLGVVAGTVSSPAAAANANPLAAFKQPRIGIDSTNKTYEWFSNKPLCGGTTAPQSFDFDEVNGDIYVAQVASPSKMGGEGNLVITRLNKNGYKYANQCMYMAHFGHAVSFGVERTSASSPVYLWIEAYSAERDTLVTTTGYGTALARVKFREANDPKKPVTRNSSGVDLFTKPIPDKSIDGSKSKLRSASYTASLDGDQLTLRYKQEKASNGQITGSQTRFAVFSLAALKKRGIATLKASGFGTPILDVLAPSIDFTMNNASTFDNRRERQVSQGWTVAGRYLYTYHGLATTDGKLSSYITVFDLQDRKQLDRRPTSLYKSLTHREPEGIAIMRDKASKKIRLVYGFSTYPKGTTTRCLSIGYKTAPFSG